MAKGPLTGALRHLRRAALLSDGAGLTDGELLERYLNERDEAAFESLLQRHGAMVLGVCRRILRNEADAHDAFQATFLVFVRKAAAIRPRALIGNWLYGVAHKTALKANAMNRQRRVKERQAGTAPRGGPREEVWQELETLLDEELSRLPERYRTAIVLCELEGKTLKEAARQLGYPQGTVASRLARGRTLLAQRLARYGFCLSGGALALTLAERAASAFVPRPLAVATVQAATAIAASQAVAGVLSPKVVALMEGVVKTMLLTKLKGMTTALLAVTLLSGGSLLAYRALGAEQAKAPRQVLATAAAEKDDKDKPDTDKKDEKAKPDKKDDKDKPAEKGSGYLGVMLKADESTGEVLVHSIFPDSPAAKAGFKENDVLLKVGDMEVKDANTVVDKVRGSKPGDKIAIHFKRGDKEMDVTITLGTRPADLDKKQEKEKEKENSEG
jgi:RNA polymerase sigma factor (sigma-70 family)